MPEFVHPVEGFDGKRNFGRAAVFKQPFAGAAQLQSGAIDDQVKFARSNPQCSATVRMEARDRSSVITEFEKPERPYGLIELCKGDSTT